MTNTKKCTVCERLLSFSKFGKHANGKYGLKSRCRECLKIIQNTYYKRTAKERTAYSRSYYKNHKASELQKKKKYSKKNKQKIKARSIEWVKQNREKVIEKRRRIYKIRKWYKYDSECYYCGGSNSLGVDHKVPTSRGGSDHPKNIVTACRSCNSSKKDKTVLEFKKHCKEIGRSLII